MARLLLLPAQDNGYPFGLTPRRKIRRLLPNHTIGRMKIAGVADVDPEAVGLAYAKSTGIFTTSDFRTLLHVSKLGMIINLTGSPEVTRQLADLSPPAVPVLPHLASRLFREIVQEALTASRRMDERADEISRY